MQGTLSLGDVIMEDGGGRCFFLRTSRLCFFQLTVKLDWHVCFL